MRLSEAILLGAMLKPQGHGPDSVRSASHSCAYGAAFDACEIPMSARNGTHAYEVAIERWPHLTGSRDSKCPHCNFVSNHLDIVWHLNDVHEWTREAIADWVATIEPVEQCNAVDASSLPDAVACPVEVKAV
jgi:hypothetical protein